MFSGNLFVKQLAVVAFLFQTLLPFYATYQVPQNPGAQEMSSIFGDKVLLCTRDGFKFVNWQEALKGQQQEHPQYECALCYVATHGQALESPTQIVNVAQAGFVADPWRIFNSAAPTQQHWRAALTRAPPSSFVA